MIRKLSFILGGLVLMLAATAPAATSGTMGLGRCWKRLESEKQLTIGYFGGSITAGAGASNGGETSWRALTTKWFRKEFPEAKITEINAAIGGTGSDLGAFRCQRDLLSGKPDLVFIEFAVNDQNAPPARAAYFEGIVRQILKSNPATEIVIVYTVSKAGDCYSAGKDPAAVVWQQQVANHYGLAVINVGKALSRQIQEGKGTWESLSKDGTHPNDAGYQIYADTVRGFLEAHRRDAAVAPGDLPSALNSNSVDEGKVVGVADVDAAGWSKETKSNPGRFPCILASNVPGTELSYTFSGTGIGLYWIVAPDSGMIEYSIDDGEPKVVSSWDKYATKSARSNYAILSDSLAPGSHRLRMKILDKKSELSTGNWIRIGAFLVK